MAARLTDSMDIVKMRMEDIHPYQNNPRKNNQAVEAVAESIRQCGYVAPIIVDEGNVILAGHTRYKALKQLCYTEAEVVVKAGLSEEQKRKYRLLDNKTNELADWDFEMLEEELRDIDFGNLELDWGLDDDADYSMLPEPEDMHTKPYEYAHYLLTVEYKDEETREKIEKFCEENGIEYATKEN